MPGIAGAVLAGGSSLRMGTDKAFLAIGGRPLITRPLAALAGAGVSPVVMVGGDAASAAELGVVTIADTWPHEGPLGGLVTALNWCPEPRLVVLSCDLAAIDAATVLQLVDAEATETDVTMAFTDRLEPLCAVWHVTRSVEPLTEAFRAGERAVRHAIRGLRIHRIELTDWSSLRDVDSPEDLTGL